MGSRYDASKPTKYITYVDTINLYGWAMNKPLPTHSFKWMEPRPGGSVVSVSDS